MKLQYRIPLAIYSVWCIIAILLCKDGLYQMNIWTLVEILGMIALPLLVRPFFILLRIIFRKNSFKTKDMPPLLRQKKRIYMKSHLLTEARTQKLICSLRRKGLDVTAERRESAMNSVMFRILIVSRILSQWKVPHINPRCGIVILTLKNDSGNRE